MSHISLMSQRREGETGGNRSESTSVAAMLAAGMLALRSARAVPRRKVCQADVPAFRCAAVWALPAH
jgi:hypothetical protein